MILIHILKPVSVAPDGINVERWQPGEKREAADELAEGLVKAGYAAYTQLAEGPIESPEGPARPLQVAKIRRPRKSKPFDYSL